MWVDNKVLWVWPNIGPMAAQSCSFKQILKFFYGDPRLTPGHKNYFMD